MRGRATSRSVSRRKTLTPQAARKAGQLAARPDDPVAGDKDAHRVAAYGRADLLGGGVVAQVPGQLAVGDGFAAWVLADQIPYPLLELVAVVNRDG
jgi:hypothetical protein